MAIEATQEVTKCPVCGRPMRPAPARFDGEETIVGFFPCLCSRDGWLACGCREYGSTYAEHLEHCAHLMRVVGTNPPNDGRQWENQCARCGSSLVWEECEHCGGEGVDGHDCGDDCCCCADPEDNVPCDICGGTGGWWVCLSYRTYCHDHPLPGRQDIESGTPEWFALPA